MKAFRFFYLNQQFTHCIKDLQKMWLNAIFLYGWKGKQEYITFLSLNN